MTLLNQKYFNDIDNKKTLIDYYEEISQKNKLYNLLYSLITVAIIYSLIILY